MPEFMDVHDGMHGISNELLAQAHQADLDIQATEGVNFKHAWADPEFREGLLPFGGPQRRGGEADPPAGGTSH